MEPLRVIKQAIEDNNIYITGDGKAPIKLSYKTEDYDVYDFGDGYYDLRLPKEPADNYRELLDMEMEFKETSASMGPLNVDIYESNIYIESQKLDIPVLLSRSLRSYEVGGLYIDIDSLDSPLTDRLATSIFIDPRDYGDDQKLIEALKPLFIHIHNVSREGDGATDYVLCFTAVNNLEILKFDIALIIVQYDSFVTTSSPKREIFDKMLDRLIDIENAHNDIQRVKGQGYDEIYQSLNN